MEATRAIGMYGYSVSPRESSNGLDLRQSSKADIIAFPPSPNVLQPKLNFRTSTRPSELPKNSSPLSEQRSGTSRSARQELCPFPRLPMYLSIDGTSIPREAASIDPAGASLSFERARKSVGAEHRYRFSSQLRRSICATFSPDFPWHSCG
ncbi:hypothetical protein KM043_004138 [Ampulex compressa]|nr:hypothetical protein KM043_004138 [Ampulex compressa]